MRRTTWVSGCLVSLLAVIACGSSNNASSGGGGPARLPDGGLVNPDGSANPVTGDDDTIGDDDDDDENGLDAGPLPADAMCDDAACAYAPIGLPTPKSGVYTDNGPVDPSAGFRSLVAFAPRNEAQLQAAITAIYTVGGAQFRKYITPADWTSTYAPDPADVSVVTSWLTAQGMTISKTATNGMLVDFTGTVGQFNTAFNTVLHNFTRVNPETGNAPVPVYGVVTPALAPAAIASKIQSIATCDPPAKTGTLPTQGPVATTPPAGLSQGFTPAQISHAYNSDTLTSAGSDGTGATVAVIVGGAAGVTDVQSFWQSFGITRADATVVQTMEPPIEHISETTIDVQWSGAMSPNSTLIAYTGPDALDTSLVYTFNEAVGLNVANVINDSFSHREDSEALEVQKAYNSAAEEAAALGITIVGSCGDEGKPDVPGASPYVTCVGGTSLSADSSGNVTSEVAWSTSGSGATSFQLPAWQKGVVTTGSVRMAADVSLNGGEPYWWYFTGSWTLAEGTSYSSPITAGILTNVVSARFKAGKPSIGYLNPVLYTDTATQKAFRDITSGGTASFQAAAGWDPPTGWGVINGAALAAALP
jgi:kumamolisin